jgi:hypothetical protein
MRSGMMMEFEKASGFQASGFRLQASGFRLQASGFRLQASGFRDGLIFHSIYR